MHPWPAPFDRPTETLPVDIDTGAVAPKDGAWHPTERLCDTVRSGGDGDAAATVERPSGGPLDGSRQRLDREGHEDVTPHSVLLSDGP